jgi:hypothetical protein
MMMKRLRFYFLIPAFLMLFGCPLDGVGTGNGGEGTIHRETNVSGKLAVALGGSREGTDEIVFDQEFSSLDLVNNDDDLFTLELKPRGARVIPLRTGIGYVTPTLDGLIQDPIEVTIPPQSLIRIFLGEARGELDREATRDSGGHVKASSVSVTGDALGAVIRNRIDMIVLENRPSLFVVDSEDFSSDTPLSQYDAVVAANDGDIYQFSPVNPEDPSFSVFEAATVREDLNAGELAAYDQAVSTAAGIFTGDTEDPTNGAFAFYSPTPAQFHLLDQALEDGDTALPPGCGASDGNFPALAPVQVLVLEEIPGFVFVRSRKFFDSAVTDEP